MTLYARLLSWYECKMFLKIHSFNNVNGDTLSVAHRAKLENVCSAVYGQKTLGTVREATHWTRIICNVVLVF